MCSGVASPVGTLFSASACVVMLDPVRPFHAAKPAGRVVNETVPQVSACGKGMDKAEGLVCAKVSQVKISRTTAGRSDWYAAENVNGPSLPRIVCPTDLTGDY